MMAVDLLRILGEAAALGALVALYLVAAWNYPMLPDRVPRHFDARGLPDAWGNKSSIWALPVIALPLYALCALPPFLTEIGRHPAPPTEAAVLAWLKAEMLLTFLWIEWRSVEVAYERATGLGAAFLPVTLLLIAATVLLLVLPGLRDAGGSEARQGTRGQRSAGSSRAVACRAPIVSHAVLLGPQVQAAPRPPMNGGPVW
jgi:Protein of unknown function (DUF1648)